MHFPSWVDSKPNGKLKPDTQRAVDRLTFITYILSLHASNRMSMRALAEHLDISHTTLIKCVKAGTFTRNSAMRIVTAFGDSFVTVEQLMNPLSIESTSK